MSHSPCVGLGLSICVTQLLTNIIRYCWMTQCWPLTTSLIIAVQDMAVEAVFFPNHSSDHICTINILAWPYFYIHIITCPPSTCSCTSCHLCVIWYMRMYGWYVSNVLMSCILLLVDEDHTLAHWHEKCGIALEKKAAEAPPPPPPKPTVKYVLSLFYACELCTHGQCVSFSVQPQCK